MKEPQTFPIISLRSNRVIVVGHLHLSDDGVFTGRFAFNDDVVNLLAAGVAELQLVPIPASPVVPEPEPAAPKRHDILNRMSMIGSGQRVHALVEIGIDPHWKGMESLADAYRRIATEILHTGKGVEFLRVTEQYVVRHRK